MGYVAAAPSLSNRQRFKSYYRTYPSDAIFVPALVSFIRYYQWKKICIITENANTFISVSSNRSMACSSASVISLETASSLGLVKCLTEIDTSYHYSSPYANRSIYFYLSLPKVHTTTPTKHSIIV